MDKNEKYEILRTTNDIICEQLKFAEAKLIFVIGFYGVVLGSIINIILEKYNCKNLITVTNTLSITAFFLIVAIIVCFCGLSPNTQNNNGDKNKNIFFWGNIMTFSNIEYDILVSKDCCDNLINQNIQISKITHKKYIEFNRSLMIVALGLFINFTVAIIVFFIVYRY